MNKSSGNLFSDLACFTVYEYAIMKSRQFEFTRLRPYYGNNVVIVSFSRVGVETPGSDPIGMYYYAGIRRFIWRNIIWGEVEMTTNKLPDHAKLLKLSNDLEYINKLEYLLLQYKRSAHLHISSDSDEVFCRILYVNKNQ